MVARGARRRRGGRPAAARVGRVRARVPPLVLPRARARDASARDRRRPFELVAVSSPSEAVLDYYEIEGARERRGGCWTLRPARPARFDADGAGGDRGSGGARSWPATARVPLYGGGRRAPAAGGGAMTERAASPTRRPRSGCSRSSRPSARAAGCTASPRRSSTCSAPGCRCSPSTGSSTRSPAQQYRPAFLAVALLLTFLVFRARGRASARRAPGGEPVACSTGRSGSLALVAVGYAAVNADEVFRRAAAPEALDIVCRRRQHRCSCSRPRGARSAGSCPRSASASSPTPTSAG